MNGILLTQNSTFIIGQVAWLLGKIMEGIFEVLNMIGIPNIGLAIILFTIVVNLLMMPLTIKQQKFSKLSAKMNPEIQAIQAKYKNRKDQDAQLAQNQEIQAVYAKYGVSPTGSCLYMLIQMPILGILILTILVFCLNRLNLRIHFSRQLREFLLLDGKRHHQQVNNNCKKDDCETDIGNTDHIQNFEDSFHYLTQKPSYLSDNECGILCQKNTVHLSS